MGGLFTIVTIFLPLSMITALLEAIMKIPEKIRDRRAVSFLRKRNIYYRRGY